MLQVAKLGWRTSRNPPGFSSAFPFASHYFSLSLIEAWLYNLNIFLLFTQTQPMRLCLSSVGECGLPDVLMSYVALPQLLLTLSSTQIHYYKSTYSFPSLLTPKWVSRVPATPTFLMFGIFLTQKNVLLDYSGCHGYGSHFPPDLSFMFCL